MNICKTFDKVKHEEMLFQLETYGVKGNILRFLTNCLYNCGQRLELNGWTSWPDMVRSEVPQRSILASLLFLI